MYGANTAADPRPDYPIASVRAEPRRSPVVREAIDRLENLTNESDAIVERVRSTFQPVLFAAPPSVAAIQRDGMAITGSDLGQALMRLCERLEGNLRSLGEVCQAADV